MKTNQATSGQGRGVKRLALALLLASVGALLGCGDGEAEPDARQAGQRSEVGEGPASAAKARAMRYPDKPVPAGAVRVKKSLMVNTGAPVILPIVEAAEAEISAFDALRIPLNIVDCGQSSGPGSIAIYVNLGLVLDVRSEDLAAAQRLGFSELAADAHFQIVWSGNCSVSGEPISTEQRIHGLAKRLYPELFSGTGPSDRCAQYSYRHYPIQDNFLGLAGEDVYVHNGRDWNFLFVGKVKDFIPHIDGIPGPATAGTAGQ